VKTTLGLGLLLTMMAVFFGLESLLGDCFNHPVFPGEASGAVVLMIVLAVAFTKLFRLTLSWLNRGKKKEEADAKAVGDCGACSERGVDDGMHEHRSGERRD
jgi:hypothetical protein